METVMNLSGCSREQAELALRTSNGDVVEALVLVMDGSKVAVPKQKTMDKTQHFFSLIRNEMTKLTESISKGFIASDQSEPSEHCEMQSHPEETVQQSSCCPEYHPPSPVSVVEIPETACPSQSECSYDSLSNDRT